MRELALVGRAQRLDVQIDVVLVGLEQVDVEPLLDVLRLHPGEEVEHQVIDTGLSLRDVVLGDRLLDAVSKRYDGDIVMIDSSCVRVHQHGANAKKGDLPILAWDVHVAA